MFVGGMFVGGMIAMSRRLAFSELNPIQTTPQNTRPNVR